MGSTYLMLDLVPSTKSWKILPANLSQSVWCSVNHTTIVAMFQAFNIVTKIEGMRNDDKI